MSAGPKADRAVKSAIDEVLTVENEMAQSMEDCKTRSEQIVNEAHDQAKAIRRRAQRRIVWIRRRCTEAINTLKASSADSPDSGEPEAIASSRHQRLQEAVERLADSLTGPSSDARNR